MKLKDYFTKLRDQAKIKNEELDKFIETVGDGEIPDPVFTLIEDNFLTRDRAKTDSKIESHFKANALSGIDHRIEEILPDLPIFNAADIRNEKNTYRKVELLKDGINGALEKVKKEKPSNDEKVKAAEAALQEAATKAQKDKETYEKALQDERLRLTSEVKGVKLNYALKERIGKFKLADEFEEDRDTVTDVILTKIGKNVLDFDDKGEIVVYEVDGTGVRKPKFNGNDQVNIDKLLEEATKPYIKKNNGDDAGGQDTKNNGRQIKVPEKPRQGARIVVNTMQ